MPRVKFVEAVTVTTMALGIPREPYQVPAGFELELPDEAAVARAKHIYGDRLTVVGAEAPAAPQPATVHPKKKGKGS